MIQVAIERGTSESEPPALPTTPAAQSVNTLFNVDRRAMRSRREKSRKYQIFSMDKHVCSNELYLCFDEKKITLISTQRLRKLK